MRLERVLGSTALFWLTREAKFRERSARLKSEQSHSEWVGWLEQLPVKELMKLGRIPKRRATKSNKPAIVSDCLRFFGVAAPNQWEQHYGGMQVDFRRSRADQADIGAISSWLRMGEQEAEEHSCPKYDKTAFLEALQHIRGLTTLSPEEFEPIMKETLRNVGVQLILVPSIPRSHVSGVARWLNRFSPLIQLSLYGKSNDKFWFSFFHEAAHIVLHASKKEEKETVYLDDLTAGRSNDPKELEADQWAADALISVEQAKELSRLRSEVHIVEFAKQIDLHPGIVVGRLQHEGLLPWNRFNALKVSYTLG